MLRRTVRDAPASVVLTETELEVLNAVGQAVATRNLQPSHLIKCFAETARLGGYLARSNDPPPGNLVIWRGLSRLTDFHVGFLAARETCGQLKGRT